MDVDEFFQRDLIHLPNVESLVPDPFTIENYVNGWRGFGGVSFATFFKNSIIVTVAATIGAVFSSALVGYGFSRCRFHFSKFLFVCVLLSMMLPFQIVMIPQYIMFNKIGWVGTYLPLIVPYFFGQGFFIFMIKQFIDGVPRELDEAAKIDGCSYYLIFARIIFLWRCLHASHRLFFPSCGAGTIFSARCCT